MFCLAFFLFMKTIFMIWIICITVFDIIFFNMKCFLLFMAEIHLIINIFESSDISYICYISLSVPALWCDWFFLNLSLLSVIGHGYVGINNLCMLQELHEDNTKFLCHFNPKCLLCFLSLLKEIILVLPWPKQLWTKVLRMIFFSLEPCSI